MDYTNRKKTRYLIHFRYMVGLLLLSFFFSACSSAREGEAMTEKMPFPEDHGSEWLAMEEASASTDQILDQAEKNENLEECEHLEEFKEFLQFFGGEAGLESFDQGHTDSVVCFAAQKMLLSGNPDVREEGDGTYSVDVGEVEKYVDQYFELPSGYLTRLSQGLSLDAAENLVAIRDERLFFHKSDRPSADRYKIEMIEEIADRYVVAGEMWKEADRQGTELLFTAIISNSEGSGDFRLYEYRIDGEGAPFEDTQVGFAKNIFLREYLQIASEEREEAGETFVGRMDVDDGTLEEIKDYLRPFFDQPILGSFDQENVYAAVVFSAQKMLRTDLLIPQYHASDDYYTLEVEEFRKYMTDYFVVPEGLVDQIKDNQRDHSVRYRYVSDRIVFSYHSVPWGGDIIIDQIELENDEYIVFGHNATLEKRPPTGENLLGYVKPFYEFAAVLVREEDGKFRLKEFCNN